ncbi:MAG: PEGA domain-containing protein [Spirochaetia bacterium]
MSGQAILFAAGSQEEKPLINDEREEWSCLFTELEGKNISEEYRYLLGSIPLLLVEEIEKIPERRISQEEVSSRRKLLLRRARQEKERRLNELIEKRDDHFLQNERKKLALVEEEIEKLRDESAYLSEVLDSGKEEAVFGQPERDAEREAEKDAEGPEENEVLPFVVNSGNRPTALASYPEVPLPEFADKNEADGVVYGELEQIEEALYLTLKMYHRDTDTSSTIYEGSFFPDRVEDFSEELYKKLTTALIGRDWAHLEIDIEPAGATLEIGGSRYSGGERVLRFLEPGEYSVSLDAPGYEEKKLSVELDAERVNTLETALNPIETVDISVESNPPGVDIFSDTVHQGSAPLTIREAVLPITILAKMPGYYEENLVIGEPPKDGELEIDLHPLSINKDQIVEAARSRFYRGVAGFFLSLPITIIGYGMSTEYAYAYNEAVTNGQVEGDEMGRLNDLSRVWYTAYLGGLFLNGVFLIDSVIHMSKYIRAAEGR